MKASGQERYLRYRCSFANVRKYSEAWLRSQCRVLDHHSVSGLNILLYQKKLKLKQKLYAKSLQSRDSPTFSQGQGNALGAETNSTGPVPSFFRLICCLNI